MAGLLPAMLSPAQAAGVTHYVSAATVGSAPGSSCAASGYSTIQAAVDAAGAGDIIQVCDGTYNEQVVVSGKDLTLTGEGDSTVIQPSDPSDLDTLYTYPTGVLSGWEGMKLAPVVLVENSNTTIQNLLIDGSSVTALPSGADRLSGILYGEAGGLISGVSVNSIKTTSHNDRTYSIDASAVAAPRSLEIANSTVDDFARTAIQVQGDEMTATVDHNTIVGPGTIGPANVPNGIVFIQDAVGSATGNTISALHYSTTDWASAGLLAYETNDGAVTFSNNEVFDVDQGVILSLNASGVTVGPNNNLHNNHIGVQFEDAATNNTVTGNTITSNSVGLQINGSLNTPPAVFEVGPGNVAHLNDLSANAVGVGYFDATGRDFDATQNWWGSPAGPARLDPNVLVDPWCVNATCTPCVGGGVACYSTIQEVVDAASPGDTVTVNAGTYVGPVVVNKSIHLVGQGDSTVIENPGNVTAVAISAHGVSLEGLKIDKEGGPGVQSGCAPVGGSGRGISVDASVNDLSLTDVTVTGATTGLRVGSGVTIDGLTVDESHFDGNCFGWYLAKETAASGTADVTNVSVTDTTFNGNQAKGIYAEKLSDALFNGITVDNSGIDPIYGFNAGIDINLKWDDYNDIEIRNSSVTGSGLTGTEPHPTFPAGITIKARDDAPSYSSPAASLDGVLLDNVTVSGGVVGVRFGESGKTNAGPTNVVITNSLLSGSLYALANETSSQTIATGMWWDGSTGPFHVDNAGNGQAILGDVDYSPFCVNSSCTTPPPPPTPTPTPTPTDPGTGDVVTPPDADPLPEEECDPETEICGSTGDDDADVNDGIVVTGPGEDHIDVDTDGDSGEVNVDAGPDNDTVVVNVGDDTPDGTVIDIDGGEGDDTIVVNIPEGVNVEIIIIGGDGNDTITYPNLEGLDGVTVTTATGEGDDVVNVPVAPGTVRIIIRLGSGDDSVAVQAGVGAVSKSASGASVTGGYDIYGGVGGESIEGSNGTDYLVGGRGRDALFGKRGHDVIKGGRAGDSLFGGRGDDTIYGGKGKDIAKGGPGTDQLLGI